MFSKPRNKIFYGWWVLFACAIVQFYLGGTFYQGFTAFFNPIVIEFGWSYTLVSLAFTFRGFESGALAPIIGFFVDRFGSRRLLFTGVITSILGFFFFSRIQSLWSFYVAFLILALGLTFASGVVTMTAVARWFQNHKHRSLAMGILTSGFGASGLLVPMVVWLTDQHGWRESVVIFGVGAAILGIPLSLLVKEPQGKRDYPEKRTTSWSASQIMNQARIREVLKKKQFWLLSLAVLFAGLAGTAITVHQIPYLVSIGISRSTAGFLVVVLSISNTAGRLVFGWLGDIYNKRHCFVAASLIKAVGVLAFALAKTVGQFIPSVIALGIGMGGVIPLRPALQVEFFGMNTFATIQGLLMGFVTLGSIISPLFAGWIFDISGDYRIAFITLAVITGIAVPFILAASSPVSQK